jgi:class 3 adenylate cyclase/tetratricopeptide (TPR) repeat protein
MPGSDSPSQNMPLITMMFTDVVESSATKRDSSFGRDNRERDHAYLAKVQTPHFELVRACCQSHGGREVSTMGDAFFLAFEDPAEAVRCAIQIQRRLTNSPIETPRGPLRLRIGIHSGFPEFFEGSWHGTDVDTTARVEAAATERQILVSARAYELTCDMTDAKFYPRGEFALKGVGQLALWEVDWEGKGPSPPATHAAEVVQRQKRIKMMAGASAALILVAGGAAYRYREMHRAVLPPQPPEFQVQARDRRSIAVFAFENLGNPEVAWLSTALPEMLNTELAASNDLRAITGEDVSTTKTDLSLKDSSSYSGNTLTKIRNILHVDYVVAGAYVASGNLPADSIRLDLRLQDARSGQTLTSFEQEGTVGAVSDLLRRAGSDLRNHLGVKNLPQAKLDTAQASLPSNGEALRYYSEGLAKLRTFDAVGAKDPFETAISIEPKLALAHLGLARTWQLLGYDGKARGEAKLAVDFSADLAPQDQRSVEAQYRELNGEWDKAIAIYQALWVFYPDEPNYALELANAQTSAGQPEEALGTLSRLATQPQLKEDPRVDLYVALAAESLSDIHKQRDAAASGADKAKRQGSRLLAAHAYWQLCSAYSALGEFRKGDAACDESYRSAPFDDEIKARSQTVWASIMEAQGKITEALEMRRQALDTARKLGSQKDIIGALQNLADTLSSQGNTKEASDHYEEAFQIARTIGDKLGLIKLEISLANDLSANGDFGGAQTLYRQSLETSRDLGNKDGIAMALENLSSVQVQLGQLADAQANIQQALALQQEAGLQSDRPYALRTLGDVFLVRGELAKARTSYEQSLKLSSEQNSPGGIAASRAELAGLSLEEGKANEAQALARQAAEEFAAEKLVDSEADARNTLARALTEEKRLPEARSEIDRGLKLSPQDRVIRLSLATTDARLKAREGKEPEARKELDANLVEAQKMGLVGPGLQIRLAQAEVASVSNPRAAEPLLRELEDEAHAKGYLFLALDVQRRRKALAVR